MSTDTLDNDMAALAKTGESSSSAGLTSSEARENTMETRLNVQGITCPRCVHHVNTALGEVEGVEQVEVKLREGSVIVKHGAAVSLLTLVKALREAGYESRAA